jgi:hypothetical protein
MDNHSKVPRQTVEDTKPIRISAAKDTPTVKRPDQIQPPKPKEFKESPYGSMFAIRHVLSIKYTIGSTTVAVVPVILYGILVFLWYIWFKPMISNLLGMNTDVYTTIMHLSGIGINIGFIFSYRRNRRRFNYWMGFITPIKRRNLPAGEYLVMRRISRYFWYSVGAISSSLLCCWPVAATDPEWYKLALFIILATSFLFISIAGLERLWFIRKTRIPFFLGFVPGCIFMIYMCGPWLHQTLDLWYG